LFWKADVRRFRGHIADGVGTGSAHLQTAQRTHDQKRFIVETVFTLVSNRLRKVAKKSIFLAPERVLNL